MTDEEKIQVRTWLNDLVTRMSAAGVASGEVYDVLLDDIEMRILMEFRQIFDFARAVNSK